MQQFLAVLQLEAGRSSLGPSSAASVGVELGSHGRRARFSKISHQNLNSVIAFSLPAYASVCAWVFWLVGTRLVLGPSLA